MKTVLIDGDILCYRISSVNESFTQWDDDIWTLSGDAKQAAYDFDGAIESIVESTGAEDYVVCLTGSTNFRKEVSETYKANRGDKRKPFLLKPLREHILENHRSELWEGLEADDVMGIMATDPDLGGTRFIYSQDKDMWTIPAFIWDFDTSTVIANPIDNADYKFFYQTLTGDPVDGYSGCPGVGPVAATKALDGNVTWEAVVAVYEKKGLTEEDALIQARQARILRYDDYDQETATVKLWSPK